MGTVEIEKEIEMTEPNKVAKGIEKIIKKVSMNFYDGNQEGTKEEDDCFEKLLAQAIYGGIELDGKHIEDMLASWAMDGDIILANEDLSWEKLGHVIAEAKPIKIKGGK